MQYSILQGDKTTGVTIMKMAKGLDTGDMISKAEMNIEGMTIHELADKLSVLGAELLVKTIPEIVNGTAVYTPQNEEEHTYASMIRKEDGLTTTRCRRCTVSLTGSRLNSSGRKCRKKKVPTTGV